MTRLLRQRCDLVTLSKMSTPWVTVGRLSGMWAVHDREINIVRKAHQRGEEGVRCVCQVILFDGEGQGQCQEEVQEGPFCSSLGDPAAWL